MWRFNRAKWAFFSANGAWLVFWFKIKVDFCMIISQKNLEYYFWFVYLCVSKPAIQQLTENRNFKTL